VSFSRGARSLFYFREIGVPEEERGTLLRSDGTISMRAFDFSATAA